MHLCASGKSEKIVNKKKIKIRVFTKKRSLVPDKCKRLLLPKKIISFSQHFDNVQFLMVPQKPMQPWSGIVTLTKPNITYTNKEPKFDLLGPVVRSPIKLILG